MRTPRVPWSELAAVGAVWLALAAWDASGTRPGLDTALVAVLAVGCALLPRRALASSSPASAEAAAILGVLAALAVACTAGGAVPSSRLIAIVRALSGAEALALATALALALPLEWSTFRRAAPAALVVGALAAFGWWPHRALDVAHPAVLSLPVVAFVLLVGASIHGFSTASAPLERARRIAPTLGAVVAAGCLSLAQTLGGHAPPALAAAGWLALVAGATVATGTLGLEHAAGLARRAITVALGLAAGAVTASIAPGTLAAVAVSGLTIGLAMPSIERWLRPDGGALLEACDAVERTLGRAENLVDLASLVLDPLRLAVHDLRAPAALWVLERQETLRVDVSGLARATALSLEHQRALLSWLRARPSPAVSDALRPHVVRRVELRPVVAALDELEALVAVPFTDEGALAGVLIVPRGRRSEPLTYEEEVRLLRTVQQVAGAVGRLCALERAHERTLKARAAQDEAEARRDHAERERDRLRAHTESPWSASLTGALDTEWVGYAPAMRTLRGWLEDSAGAPLVALVSDGRGAAVASARVVHEAGRGGPFVVLDAAQAHPRDALVALVGDGRTTPPTPGALERAEGGTLVLLDAMALGVDAHVALADALRTGEARRLGTADAYRVRARVVLVTRRPPRELDLPVSLLVACDATTFEVPSLRDRGEDLEALVLRALERGCRVHGRPALGIAPEALAALRAYPWPGDVEELDASISEAVQRARGTRVTVDDLDARVRAMVPAVRVDDDDDVLDGYDA